MQNNKKLIISVANNRFSTNLKNISLTWNEFLKRISTPVRTSETYEQFLSFDKGRRDNLKDVGGFIAGETKDGRRTAGSVINRCMITLDADDINPGETQKILKFLDGLQCAFAVYSTRNHSSYKPRLRIIIPTNRLMTLDEYEPVARKIASYIGVEIMDTSTYQSNRLMYWPSCSIDGEFIFWTNQIQRPIADVDEILKLYKNWTNTDEWPKSQKENKIIKKNIIGEIKKQEDPTLKNNVVGIFCRIYDIHSAIENFLTDVYAPGNTLDKYTHIGSSTANGATVYENGKFLYSYHATDPAHGILCNSFDLVRIHKFGQLDEEYLKAKGATKPSYKAMYEFAESLPEIKAEKHQGAIKEFEENPEKGLATLFFDNKKFLIEDFCKYFIENEHLGLINGELYIYDNGAYIADDKVIQRKILRLIPGMLESKRNECIKYMRLLVLDNELEDNTNYVCFKNGNFNLTTKELTEHNPNIITTNLIAHNYTENAYSPLVDITLNKICCNDLALRNLIEELIGYTFYRNNKYAKSFFLYGPSSNNGKSVFLNLIKAVLGEKNISTLAYEDLGDRFKTAEIAGKLSNIGDDCSKNFNSSSAIFKKLSTGETITVERKGQDPFGFNNYATLIFSFNELPRTEDKSQATARKRMCIIPFNAKFKETDVDFDPNINEKLREESCIEYVIKLGIEGLLRVIKNKGFTKVKAVEREADNYESYNNPLLQFIKEKEEDEDYNFEDYTPSQVYQQYRMWSTDNGFDKPMNMNSFGLEMKRQGYDRKVYRIDGKLSRHYTKSDGNN